MKTAHEKSYRYDLQLHPGQDPRIEATLTDVSRNAASIRETYTKSQLIAENLGISGLVISRSVGSY